RDYTYQPVILEMLPELGGKDATIAKVILQTGDRAVDAANNPVTLAEGMAVRPAGCYSAACAVTFTGEPVEMEQLAVTFRLREGVRWSDGTPVTADDSVYSYEIDADASTPTDKDAVERTASYRALDEQTVVWTGLPGFIDPQYASNFWMPLPRQLWQVSLKYRAADLLKAPESTRAPMGWGAFVVEEWLPGSQITLVQNQAYFSAGEGQPGVDKIVFRFIPDVNDAVAQLLSGDCDIITERADLEDLVPLLLRLEEQSLAIPVFTPDTRWEHLDFNINPASKTKRPDFFEDARTRQAIAYCLNREGIVKTQLHGKASVMDSYLPAEHPLYAEDLATYPYNPERGKALLDEIGWRDEDGNGTREAYGIPGIRDKTPLAFRWQSTTASPMTYLEQFQSDLAFCGMDVTISQLPVTEFFAMSADGPLFGRNFDLASFAWMTEFDPPPCQRYMSTEIPSEANNWSGLNLAGFIDTDFDTACAQAQNALPGSAEFITGHQTAQQRFAGQLPALPLFLRLQISVIRPEVGGYAPESTGSFSLWNIESLRLEQP
ncbi:MAG: peptide ABC transporter substrate-binding protein, partial [Anaerolineae bacterium]|nr:peptide ABC transporter substrate-binding protein [Anaerolineae bacterium]